MTTMRSTPFFSYQNTTAKINEITCEALHDKFAATKTNLLLIDVREKPEHDAAYIASPLNITQILLPLSLIKENPLWAKQEISKVQDKKDISEIVTYCRSGKRSAEAIHIIQQLTPQILFSSLQEGMNGWEARYYDEVVRHQVTPVHSSLQTNTTSLKLK